VISKGYLTAKVKEICIWKGQNYPSGIIDVIFPKFENCQEKDLDAAVRDLMEMDDKFSPAKLKSVMDRCANNRREEEWKLTKVKEKEEAKEIWNTESGATCNRTLCRGCRELEYCKIRGREWMKGIKLILEGRTTCEKGNNYMWYEFMGGVK